MPVIIGTPLRSSLNMVIVLSIYGVAIMAGPCVQAFSGLPEQVLLSADACGYGRLRRWWQIELPLALAVIASARGYWLLPLSLWLRWQRSLVFQAWVLCLLMVSNVVSVLR